MRTIFSAFCAIMVTLAMATACGDGNKKDEQTQDQHPQNPVNPEAPDAPNNPPTLPVTNNPDPAPQKPENPIPADPATQWDQVAPIIAARCGTCHQRPRAGKPLITTYESARAVAAQIRIEVNSGDMPPEPGDMTAEERSAIIRWVDDGARP